MEGSVSVIKGNTRPDQSINKTYGFIFGDDREEYFFHKSALVNCNIYQLEEGDRVSFNVETDPDGRINAKNVRKKYSSINEEPEYDVSPGINPSVNINYLNEDEKKIVQVLKKVFYITNGGKDIKIGDSSYRYILVKPTNYFHVNFNMNREIVVIFSDYISFEPRSLDVAAKVASQLSSKLRLDRSCQVLISNDSNIEQRMTDVLKDRNLDYIVVPFSYRELQFQDFGEQNIQDRFRKYLFDADLFTSSDPIQNDVFFFGRRDYARDIANQCRQALNCGLFGLRRSGKTSMLLAIKRILENEGYAVLLVPCQSELVTLNWQVALYQIVGDISAIMEDRQATFDKSTLHDEADYKGSKTNSAFTEDLNALLSNEEYPIVIMLDEIESITFDVVSSSELWRDGESYVNFWNVLRGYRTKYPKRLSIVIAGTNPMINEVAILKNGKDNPMLGQISKSNQGTYLKPFDVESTKTMINTLGGYMGIKFTDNIAATITEDCGGHPFLIRMLCGHINKFIKDEGTQRPVTVSRAIYEKARAGFEKSGDAEGFYLMILNILHTCYDREYNVLKILANEGDAQLSQTLDNVAIQHLLGYGLVENNEGHLAIRFDTIKRYLQGQYKFERQNLSIEEQAQEINTRFSPAEQKLRSVIRDMLRASFGTEEAKQKFISAMNHTPGVKDYMVNAAQDLKYRQLFDPTVNKGCFFTVLMTVIKENYNLFENVFETDLETTQKHLTVLNVARRLPSHSVPEDAENWSDEKFEEFRESISWLETILNEFD